MARMHKTQESSAPPRHSLSSRNKYGKWLMSYSFLAPAVILIALFLVYPLGKAFVLSFHKWRGLGDPVFVGLDNYQHLFKSPQFWTALRHTFVYTFFAVTLTIVIGLALALAIERRVPGWKFFKFIFYISVMLSVSVVAILFTQILEPNYGLLNKLLSAVGLSSLTNTWLSNPKLAMGCLIAMATWQYSGFTMLLFLAAMEGIDPAVHEAATMDGVSEFRRIFSITLPIIKRTIFVVIMLQIIFSIKSFDLFWIVTAGGPGDATETLTTLLYRNAMAFGKYGYAAAISIVMIVIVSVISIFYIRASALGEQDAE